MRLVWKAEQVADFMSEDEGEDLIHRPEAPVRNGVHDIVKRVSPGMDECAFQGEPRNVSHGAVR